MRPWISILVLIVAVIDAEDSPVPAAGIATPTPAQQAAASAKTGLKFVRHPVKRNFCSRGNGQVSLVRIVQAHNSLHCYVIVHDHRPARDCTTPYAAKKKYSAANHVDITIVHVYAHTNTHIYIHRCSESC